MSKYMLIFRSTDESKANFEDIDFEQMLETMGKQLKARNDAQPLQRQMQSSQF